MRHKFVDVFNVLFMDAFYSDKGHEEGSSNDSFKSGFQKSFP